MFASSLKLGFRKRFFPLRFTDQISQIRSLNVKKTSEGCFCDHDYILEGAAEAAFHSFYKTAEQSMKSVQSYK